MDVLEQIHAKWEQDGGALDKLGDDLLAELHTLDRKNAYNPEAAGGIPGAELLHEAYELYRRQFDEEYGGFGSAPKFPSPHNLSFLLAYSQLHDQPEALRMVEHTLESMYKGGMYDHVGFGFARYSTDREWLVPHFEKMLYDNALLANVYLEAFQLTEKPLYAEIAEQIFTYVLRDMTSPEGAYLRRMPIPKGWKASSMSSPVRRLRKRLGWRICIPTAMCMGLRRKATSKGKIFRISFTVCRKRLRSVWV